jgi:hypothetical protein
MKTIHQLIQNQTGGGLAFIVQRSLLLRHIDTLFKTSQSLLIGQHCHIINMRDKTLVIQTDSAAWANRLRYMIPDFLEFWHSHKQLNVIEITHIDIKIGIDQSIEKCPIQQQKLPKISAHSALLLRQLADSTAHPELKSVLLSLANISTE